MTIAKQEYKFKEGLEDVVATTSSICYLDGINGVLAYRGIDIHELAEKSTFEEVAYLLWFGRLPKLKELEETKRQLAAERALPEQVVAMMRGFPKDALPMVVLRTVVSALAMYDPEAEDNSYEANVRKAIRLTAKVATIVTAFDRLRKGKEPVEPRLDLSHAGNFVYMLSGELPDKTSERAMDIALILHADHELNASTFAGRVTAATLSDIYSAVTSAIAALKGPLHGGANEAVMRMILSIGDADDAESHVRKLLSEGKKIPGFGHRVYRTEDPRATHLRKMSRALSEKTGNVRFFQVSQRIEELMRREKGINCNVDFYSATVYYNLGFDIDLFTPIFAVSRVSGWTAHIIEQHSHNRLIRPRAEYTGPAYPQPYVPIDQR